jgi:hypothetical protein
MLLAYIRRTCHSFRRCLEAVVAKIAAISNRWIPNRRTHNNQPFSGLPKASIRDEGLYFEKKQFSPRLAPPCSDVLVMFFTSVV